MGLFFDFSDEGGGPLRNLSGGGPGLGLASPDMKMQPVQSPKTVDPPKPVSTPAAGGDIMSIIDRTAKKYGVPADWMRKSAKIESDFNPREVSPTGARGLYQFMPGTAKVYGLGDPMDPQANADAAARLYLDNRNGLEKRIGRAPTGGEVYLAHQQGLSGAGALLSNPDKNVVDALTPVYGGSRARAEKAVKVNGGSVRMTAGQFASQWTSKFDGTLIASSAPDGSEPAISKNLKIWDDQQRQPGLGFKSDQVGPITTNPVQMPNIISQQVASLNSQEPGRYIAMPVDQYHLWQQRSQDEG
ncbi:MAG: transglycosylase SLT domain-containing protein [Rhodopseudomonas sp.]|nr:transglycosylase SLT domain-containing protein [Rhodopseudomonas sp.]